MGVRQSGDGGAGPADRALLAVRDDVVEEAVAPGQGGGGGAARGARALPAGGEGAAGKPAPPARVGGAPRPPPPVGDAPPAGGRQRPAEVLDGERTDQVGEREPLRQRPPAQRAE